MVDQNFLASSIKLFRYYKKLGEGALTQLGDDHVQAKPNEASNSIGHIVHHLSGNMLSRWTDLLTADGEKPWRNREAEFSEEYPDKKSLMEAWDAGWGCLLTTLETLTPSDLEKVIYIRNEGQPVWEAIQRQLAHYPLHVGQIIYEAKALLGEDFKSLSIPKGASKDFNKEKFRQDKEIRHFTDRL